MRTPRLLDIEYLKTHGTPEEQTYFGQFGFNKLTISSTDYPKVSDAFSRLTSRFYNRYAERRLNKETMELWQIALQNRCDEILPKYEIAYTEYATKAAKLLNPIKTVESDGENQASGSDGVTGDTENRSISTPDEAINEDDDFADSLDKSHSSRTTTYGRKDVQNATVETTEGGEKAIKSYVAALQSYADIDTLFIAEFENNFLNIFDSPMEVREAWQ